MPPGITIVGLGPGGADLWTAAARQILTASREVWLRTARCPGAETLAQLDGQSHVRLQLHSFDTWHEEAAGLDSLYDRIADRVVQLGAREQGVVYAVPGHPSVGEATVTRIRALAAEADLPVKTVPGLSCIEPALTALGIDVLDGLQVVDADQLAAKHHPPLDPDRPALVPQLWNRRQAAQVKLTLMNSYPDSHHVSLVRAAGTDQEQTTTCTLLDLDCQPIIDHLTILYLPPVPHPAGLPAFQDTVARLRAPGGCPWDRQQTHESLRPYLLEESYEVLAALDAGDTASLLEELGDLLLQIVLHAQIATESGEFLMADVIGAVDAKLRRRHPHVFGDIEVNSVSEVLVNWEAIKKAEKAGRTENEGDEQEAAPLRSVLEGVPPGMPALARAQAVSERAARVGFEWPNLQGVLEKIAEEAEEVAAAESPEAREAEIGDLLFSLVNAARWLGVDAETALRTTNERFSWRFRTLERLAQQRGLNLDDLNIEALDELWEETKRMEARASGRMSE